MKLIILLLLPAFAFSQTKRKVLDLRDSSIRWYSLEPAYAPSKNWRSQSWEINFNDGAQHYTIMSDTVYYFRSTLQRDTLHIEPSLFDSTAIRAKVIIVAGKIFQLKENKK